MEDKPPFLIPKGIYFLIIAIMFHQISGYLFSTDEIKALNEEKIKFIGALNEMSPITFLLYYKGQDNMTLIVFIIMQFIMIFYYFYVSIYTYIRLKHIEILEKNIHFFRLVNQNLNIFFTFYWWIFLTPYLEINNAFLHCNKNSFLVQMRNNDCSQVSIMYPLFGYIGLTLANLTGIISIFFFRSYEFNQKDYLRRKFSWIIIFVLGCRSIVVFMYYLKMEQSIRFKEILMVLLILLLQIDIIANRPYNNQTILKFYVCGVSCFSVGIALIILFIETNLLIDNQLFYYFIFLVLLISSAQIVCLNYSYQKAIRLNSTNFKKNFKRIDLYLEEIFQLLENHKRNEEAQFRLFEILVFHQQSCYNFNCHCKFTTFKSQESSIIKEDVLKFIETMFLYCLKQKLIQQNQSLYEHLSLKYFSFIAKYRNNPVKAYFELKQLISQHTNEISFYFTSIQNIVSQRIEKLIKLHQENKTKEYKEQNKYYQDSIDEDINRLQLEDFIFSDKVKINIIPLIQEFINCKVKLFDRMRKGYDKMSQFGNQIIQMSKLATLITKSIQNFLGQDLSFYAQTNSSNKTSQNILSMYEGIVLNRYQESLKYEELILDLKKRDYLLNLSIINTLNILKGNVQTVLVSLSKERGKILNKNQKKINNFFGYNQNIEFNLQQVGQLMPQFLSEIHDGLMQNYIRRGYSQIIKQNTYSYGQDSYGFLIPLSISIENIFGIKDDFCMFASLLKLENAKEFIVINPRGQILGLTQLIYKDVFTVAEENQEQLSKKFHLDAFDVKLKISFYMVMPDIIDIIIKQQIKQEEEEELGRNNETFMIETVVQNQQGVIKIPDAILDLHQQYKSNQFFVSEKSKGLSLTSIQQQFQTGEDTLEIIESYQNFYKENQIEWNKENLISETKIKYDVVRQKLICFQDNKKIETQFYIVEINEQTSITNQQKRKDSLESPRRLKKKGDQLTPNKRHETKKLTFFEIIKLAAKKQRSQNQISQQNSILQTQNNEISPTNTNIKKINLNEDFDRQSSTSLEKYMSNNLLSPSRLLKSTDRKYNKISSFSQISDKQWTISLQNVQSGEKSFSGIPQDTDITSNQHIELSSRYEDNQQFLKKLVSNNNNNNLEIQSPIKRLTGPQFSKHNQPRMKSNSKDFEPKISLEEAEDKIKIKNIQQLQQYSSMQSSQFGQSSNASPLPKLSLWQRIKNKVSTTSNQQSALRGISLFLKTKPDLFLEDRIDKLFKRPDTVSSNSAIDMENEIDFEDSSLGKKGTTVKRNLKSNNPTKTHHQIRSVSNLSSHSSNSYNHGLFHDIAYSFHKPSIFFKLKLFFGIFIAMFIILQFGLSIGIVREYSQLNDELHFNQIILQDNSELSNQVLNSINYSILKAGLIDPQYSSQVQEQIKNIAKSYQENFPKRLESYLKFQKKQGERYDISIFSFKQRFKFKINYFYLQMKNQLNSNLKIYSLKIKNRIENFNSQYLKFHKTSYFFKNQQRMLNFNDKILHFQQYYEVFESNNFQSIIRIYGFSKNVQNSLIKYHKKQSLEKKTLAELKFYSLNSVAQVIKTIQNGYSINEDQFYYLVKNSITIQGIDEQILNQEFDDFANLEKSLTLRSDIFIGTYILIFIIFIFCFIPFFKGINSYQKRVLLLISRITNGECLIELNKLNNIYKYIQNQNEVWVYKNFILIDQQSNSESPKHSVKSANFSKIQKTPIQQQIKNQKIKNYKQIIFFIFLSFIGLSYFAIFIIIIKQYSIKSLSYLDFFKFSQQSIPAINCMIVNWSLLISNQTFKKHYKMYPQLDIVQMQQHYNESTQRLSTFLVQFQQQINKLSSSQITNVSLMADLYSKSICNFYDKEEDICSQLPQNTKEIYQSGLAELISNYLQIVKNFDFLTQESQNQIIEEKILKEYFSSQLFIELILIRYKNTIKFIYEIIKLNIQSFDYFYDELNKTHLLYFLVFGIFLIILFILMGFLLYQSSLTKLNHINFGLTCLPASKIQEESTLQMLKFIKKI